MDTIRIEIGSDFVPLVKMEAPNLISEIARLRGTLEVEAKFVLPAVRIIDSVELSPLQYRILLRESEVVNGEARTGQSAVAEVVEALRESALQHRDELAP